MPRATDARLTTAERSARQQARLLRTTRSELGRTQVALERSSRRSRARIRDIARLRRALRRARRAP